MRISDWSSDVCSSDLDRFALGEPLPPDFGQQLRRVGLVEHDRARRPAIGESEPVELVEQARPGRGRKAGDRQRAEMMLAEPRREPADERLVGRSEEHTSELQSLMHISYAVFCLKKKKQTQS